MSLVTETEIIEDKDMFGRLRPGMSRKPNEEYARRKHISSTFGRGFKSLQLHRESRRRVAGTLYLSIFAKWRLQRTYLLEGVAARWVCVEGKGAVGGDGGDGGVDDFAGEVVAPGMDAGAAPLS